MIMTNEELEFKVDTRIKQIEKRSVGNPHDKHRSTPLSIEPTGINFKGTDEPVVCSQFGCRNHLTSEQQLYGSRCVHCQEIKKADPTKCISHPIKQTA